MHSLSSVHASCPCFPLLNAMSKCHRCPQFSFWLKSQILSAILMHDVCVCSIEEVCGTENKSATKCFCKVEARASSCLFLICPNYGWRMHSPSLRIRTTCILRIHAICDELNLSCQAENKML